MKFLYYSFISYGMNLRMNNNPYYVCVQLFVSDSKIEFIYPYSILSRIAFSVVLAKTALVSNFSPNKK